MQSMDLPARTQVAIVGGGPTGLALAVTWLRRESTSSWSIVWQRGQTPLGQP